MAMTCDRVREVAAGFVLGALDQDEMIAVSDHLDTCSRPHPEVDDFGGVLPYIAESLEPVEPPAWLRESIIAAAKADLVARRRLGKPSERRVAEPAEIPVSTTAQVQRPTPVAEVIPFARTRVSRRRQAMAWTMRVAAAAAIVALAANTYVLQGELGKARELQSQADTMNYVLTQHDTRTAQMVAMDGSKTSGLAALRPTGNIVVKLHGLAATKGDQVYAVWLRSDTTGLAKVGSFTADDSGEGYLDVTNVPTSANLWIFICREPNNGVTKPTGPMVVSGTF